MTNSAPIIQVEAGNWVCKLCNHLPKDTHVKTANINFNYYIQAAQ